MKRLFIFLFLVLAFAFVSYGQGKSKPGKLTGTWRLIEFADLLQNLAYHRLSRENSKMKSRIIYKQYKRTETSTVHECIVQQCNNAMVVLIEYFSDGFHLPRTLWKINSKLIFLLRKLSKQKSSELTIKTNGFPRK